MAKKEFGKICFNYNATMHWNNLPHEAKIAESVISFKSILGQRMSLKLIVMLVMYFVHSIVRLTTSTWQIITQQRRARFSNIWTRIIFSGWLSCDVYPQEIFVRWTYTNSKTGRKLCANKVLAVNYILNYQALKFYIKHRWKVTKIHSGILFDCITARVHWTQQPAAKECDKRLW